MVPPNFRGGKVAQLEEGTFKVDEVVVQLDNGEQVKLVQTWPVRKARPVRERLMPTIPLITGQRVMDFLFPIAKGGTAAIPGGFGTGKCVVGTTPVYLNDGSVRPIEEIYRGALGDFPDEGVEQFVFLSNPLRVRTFDGETIGAGFATAVYRGRTSSITTVQLESGRSVQVTPIHKLFVSSEAGVIEKRAADLQVGDRVLATRCPAEGGLHSSLAGGSQHLVLEATEPMSVFVDRVKAATTIQEETVVYDLTVEGTHNFVGGDLPVILHNTVSEQQLSKWCDAQVVIYIGCGERGNEMREVLSTFPKLIDPYTGAPLMERMALIANTSNMPVAAREIGRASWREGEE